MSSLGYLLPGQYATAIPQPDGNGYNMDPNRVQSVTTAPQPYSQTASTSPSLYQGRIAPQYGDGRQHSTASGSIPGSSGRMTVPYDSPAVSDYSIPSAHSVPPLSGLVNSMPASTVGPPLNAGLPHYSPSIPRQSSIYDTSYYGHPQPYTAAPSHASIYAPQQGTTYGPTSYSSNDHMSRASSSDLSAKAQNQRPKAQCWEHGCNGRQFSTFSNLLRHQREKSGTAAKSFCPKCGAEFTRTTARNGHLQHDKCTKKPRQSEER